MSPLPDLLPPLARAGIPLSFLWPVKFCAAVTTATYLASLATGNVSQVDRLWTFLPVIYSAYFALLPLWPASPPLPLFPYAPSGIERSIAGQFNARALLMLALQVIWMTRLSYNAWRRGFFNFGDEDYRWAVLRARIPKWLFQIVNLTFIAITQNILLFLLSIPTHNAAVVVPNIASGAHSNLKTSDYVLTALTLVTLAFETTADNQQYAYQTHKRTGVYNENEWPGARIAWTQEDVQRGFITRGLWAWSRHPNFACEQTFWILQALFPILATGTLPKLQANEFTPLGPLVPPIALCMLFFSSTIFTESISLSKYPIAYKAYQQRVAMFVPFLTPFWGLVLKIRGKKDRLVYGRAKAE